MEFRGFLLIFSPPVEEDEKIPVQLVKGPGKQSGYFCMVNFHTSYQHKTITEKLHDCAHAKSHFKIRRYLNKPEARESNREDISTRAC